MKWLSLHVGGQRIAVHIVRPSHPKLDGCYGMYLPDECLIYLSSELEGGALQDTLWHELDHAVNDIAGVSNLLGEAVRGRHGRRGGKRVEELEERIVRARTPIWHRLLKDLGFRFPKGPRE